MEFWHLIGRGVEKRDVVADKHDNLRFIHNLYALNDRNATPNYVLNVRREDYLRVQLVDIHSYCLMKNHYHLLVSERIKNGISLFMQKINMGYTKYFNNRHERSGALWQGKYRKVRIKRDAHFLHIPFYIHLNPLDYVTPEWRKGETRNTGTALKSLLEYRWSSHLDYLGIRNFPSIIRTDVLNSILGTRAEYERTITEIIQDPSLAQESEYLEYQS
jgi:putative transposase